MTTTDGAPFWVRTAEGPDASGTLLLEEHMHGNHPFKLTERGEIDRSEAQELEWIREHAEKPGYLMLVASPSREPGAAVVGRLTFRSGNRRKLAHHGTFGIAVHGDWRGRGVGTALITSLLDWGASHPTIEKVCLGVFAGNVRARKLYRSLGFVKEGRSPKHFKLGPGEYSDDITMSVFVKPGLAPAPFKTWRGAEPKSGS